jgi:recombination protein RecT
MNLALRLFNLINFNFIQNNNIMSNQLATLKNTLSSAAMREQFARALPKHLSPERFCRIAITALTRTPKLADCTQESLMKCLLDLSAFGLEPDGRRAHLIPYKDQCTLVIDWKGLAELAMRSGIIAKLHADIVCENDAFEYDLGEVVRHSINWKAPRGAMYAAYALAITKDGAKFCAVMTKEEIDGIRGRSRSGNNGPWVTDYNEMAKKTAFRRLAKWLPLSAEFRDAQDKDEEPMEREIQAAVVPPVKALFNKPKEGRAEEAQPEESWHVTLGKLISDNQLTAGDVLDAAEQGGIFLDAAIPLIDQPEDVVREILASWDGLQGMLKGGAK